MTAGRRKRAGLRTLTVAILWRLRLFDRFLFTAMSDPPPLVSIGLPVYNGADYLAAALDAILGQSFEDFELILSDNASTDGTRGIAEAYAARDRRVRLFRQERNLGAAPNFNFTVRQARGRYFKWAAHDDLIAPAYLERCVEALEADPGLVLVTTGARVIDAEGKAVEDYGVVVASEDPRADRRFYEFTRLHHRCYHVFGLIRREVLLRTPMIGSFAGSDRCLLSELALYGPVRELPTPLFFPRRHAGQSIEMLFHPTDRRTRMIRFAEWFDPANQGKLILPNWRILGASLGAIRRAPLGLGSRLRCAGQMVRWLFAYHNGAKLGRDLLLALLHMPSRLGRRGAGGPPSRPC